MVELLNQRIHGNYKSDFISVYSFLQYIISRRPLFLFATTAEIQPTSEQRYIVILAACVFSIQVTENIYPTITPRAFIKQSLKPYILFHTVLVSAHFVSVSIFRYLICSHENQEYLFMLCHKRKGFRFCRDSMPLGSPISSLFLFTGHWFLCFFFVVDCKKGYSFFDVIRYFFIKEIVKEWNQLIYAIAFID